MWQSTGVLSSSRTKARKPILKLPWALGNPECPMVYGLPAVLCHPIPASRFHGSTMEHGGSVVSSPYNHPTHLLAKNGRDDIPLPFHFCNVTHARTRTHAQRTPCFQLLAT